MRGSGGAQVPGWQETCQGSTLGNVALARGHQGKAGMEAGGRVMESGRARWRERSDCGGTDDISPRPIGPTAQLQRPDSLVTNKDLAVALRGVVSLRVRKRKKITVSTIF